MARAERRRTPSTRGHVNRPGSDGGLRVPSGFTTVAEGRSDLGTRERPECRSYHGGRQVREEPIKAFIKGVGAAKVSA